LDRDGFIETLNRQYTELVHEALLESESHGEVNFETLKTKISYAFKASQRDGLPSEKFHAILRDVVPDYTDRLELG
jgi:hypothetical protein